MHKEELINLLVNVTHFKNKLMDLKVNLNIVLMLSMTSIRKSKMQTDNCKVDMVDVMMMIVSVKWEEEILKDNYN